MESCHELVEAGGGGAGPGAAAAASLRAHLARCDVHEGHAYLQADEVRNDLTLLYLLLLFYKMISLVLI